MANSWQKDIFTSYKVALCKTIGCESEAILVYLENEHIFSMEDSDLVRGKLPNRTAASNKLLEIVVTRTQGYDGLMKILKELNQDGAYEILLKGKLDNEPPSEIGQQPPAELPSNSATTSNLYTNPTSKSNILNWIFSLVTSFLLNLVPEMKEFYKRMTPANDEEDGPKRKNLKLQRPAKAMNFPDDAYHLPTGNKGPFILINVTSYENGHHRDSAKIDTYRLSSVTVQIGFGTYNEEFSSRDFWTAQQIIDAINEFRDHCNRADVPAIFVFVGGHGKDGNIIASDGKPVHIWRDILSKFNTENCWELRDKPKIFMFQACQKFRMDTRNLPAEDDAYPAGFDNFVILKATIPGFAAKRTSENGSVMVYFFTEVMRTNARCWSFQRMINEVELKVAGYEYTPTTTDKEEGNFIGGQIMDVKTSRLKPLYFNLEPQVEHN